ncbi:unnamed protein product [Adineta ricciae]|nr:unnamed protein product [Adineta ricciae]
MNSNGKIEDKKNEITKNITSLLSENPNEDFLTKLDELYKNKFQQTLSIELIKLTLPDFYKKLIVLTSPSNVENDENSFLEQMTTSGIIPNDFLYSPNPLTFTNEAFVAFISNIDEQNQLIYIRSDNDTEYMEQLTNNLQIYYSHSISEQFIVKQVNVHHAYVGKYEDIYHRLFIDEIHDSTYVINYVDIGLRKQIQKDCIQLKSLLNCFAEYPCLTIACRLHGIEFLLHNYQLPQSTFHRLKYLCRGGPFNIYPHNEIHEVLNVVIRDLDDQCLNDLLVKEGLAFSFPMNNHQNTNINVNHALDDYDQDELNASTMQLSVPDNDYEIIDYSLTSINSKQNENQIQKQPVKSNNHSNRRLNSSTNNVNSPNRNRKNLQITISSDQQRHVQLAFTNLGRRNRRENKTTKKQDDFADWMCSLSSDESLWSNETYRKALLTYLGRIYDQGAHMYRVFTQVIQNVGEADDLDILYRLIEETKHKDEARMSIGKWEDKSRITRRINDLKVIFEFNPKSSSQNRIFDVFPLNLTEIINCEKIKSYFDLGCGDGMITSAIGEYLHLNKENILGGDVFKGQLDKISFVQIDANQSKIDLPNNRVDLVTSFVTFHHISEIDKTVKEIGRILRPGGYLILREHDCDNSRSLPTKYLHFVHAIMMISRVGEFANISDEQNKENLDWKEQKSEILQYTKTIRYQLCQQWHDKLSNFGFSPLATLFYRGNNPQRLFYSIYQKQ